MLRIVDKINSDIAALNNTEVIACGKKFTIEHNLVFTMLDSKTAQTATGTTSAELVSRKDIDIEACKLGISSLHARIKFMECILHLAYNLPFQKWSASKNEHKILKQENKHRIQVALKERMGIRVDAVQQGTGSSNDGNTSRRFFEPSSCC